jgi:hypothetical protein
MLEVTDRESGLKAILWIQYSKLIQNFNTKALERIFSHFQAKIETPVEVLNFSWILSRSHE